MRPRLSFGKSKVLTRGPGSTPAAQIVVRAGISRPVERTTWSGWISVTRMLFTSSMFWASKRAVAAFASGTSRSFKMRSPEFTRMTFARLKSTLG